jgi:hypothetical protein
MEAEIVCWNKRIVIITAVVFIALLYFFADARTHALPKCPFHSVTHLYCPGCGSQRALSALLHGNLIDAFHDNVLMVLFLPLLLYWLLVSFRFNGKRKVLLFYNVLFVRLVLIVVLCFWLLRNIPVYPFSILAPLN